MGRLGKFLLPVVVLLPVAAMMSAAVNKNMPHALDGVAAQALEWSAKLNPNGDPVPDKAAVMSSRVTASDKTVTGQIAAVATSKRVCYAMLVGAHMESGWRPNAVGDSGWAHGVYQINRLAHPDVPAAKARDVTWSSKWMLARYEMGVTRVPAGKWSKDPGGAAALAAYYAERPRNMYPRSRVNAAWKATTNLGGSKCG